MFNFFEESSFKNQNIRLKLCKEITSLEKLGFASLKEFYFWKMILFSTDFPSQI